MAGPLLIEALGVVIELDLAGVEPGLADAVRATWRDAAATASAAAVAAAPSLTIGVAELAAGAGSDLQVLSDLSQRVTLEAITARKGELWMLHAAGLALPDGRVVALVGPSGRGKTTAARALGRRFGYVSDETVGVDRDGRVHPYRKPLSVIEGGGFKAQRAASDLGMLPPPSAPLRLAAVVLLDRDAAGPEHPVAESVDLGDALDELVTQTSFLASMDAPLQTIAAILAATGGMRRWRYREAADLADAVDDLLETAAPVRWTPAARIAAPAGPGRYSRVEVLDAVLLEDPDRVAVVHVAPEEEDGVAWVLGGIAPALWEAADDADAETLVAAAVAHHGVPGGEDPGVLVRAAVDELVAAGALRRGAEPVWRIGPHVAWQGDGRRVVVLDLDRPDANVLALEGSAALIWAALADGGTVDQVVARVAEVAGMAVDAIRPDVHVFAQSMVLAGLIGQ